MTVKEANRVLIPHTLTKKRTPAVNSAPSSKKNAETSSGKSVSSKGDNSLFQGLSSYTSDSDDDEEEGGQSSNFFSLGDSKKEPKELEVILPQPPPPSNNLQKMNLPAPVTKPISSSVSKSETLKMDSLTKETNLQKDSLSNQDEYIASKQEEPLIFNSAAQNEPLKFKSSFNSITPNYYSQTRDSHSSQQQTTGHLNEDGTEKYQYPQVCLIMFCYSQTLEI